MITPLDVKVIPGHIEQSIIKSFKVQINTEVKVSTTAQKETVFKKYNFECVSTLHMKSASLIGTLSLAFPEKTYLEVLFRMIGEKYEAVDPSNSDGASEILNIIYANARKDINNDGFNFEPAIPSTITGKQLAVSSAATEGVSIFFECLSGAGQFLVILGIKKNM